MRESNGRAQARHYRPGGQPGAVYVECAANIVSAMAEDHADLVDGRSTARWPQVRQACSICAGYRRYPVPAST
jgi:hypothetical protein